MPQITNFIHSIATALIQNSTDLAIIALIVGAIIYAMGGRIAGVMTAVFGALFALIASPLVTWMRGFGS